MDPKDMDRIVNRAYADTSRSAIEEGTAQLDARAAQREFDAELPAFCRLLDVSPALLEKLPLPTLLLLVNIRLFKLLTTKLRALDTRLDTLERPLQ
jgi:hypothetical protein